MRTDRVARRRFGLTEGRIYSGVIIILVAALLLPSLSHWRPVAALKPLAGTTFAPRHQIPAAAPATTPTTMPPSVPLPSSVSLSSGFGGFALPSSSPLPATSPVSGSAVPPPLVTLPSGTASGVGTGPQCKEAALNASVAQELNQLNATLKILPTATLETALGLATGCNSANPALLAVGALSEVGDDLSTLFKEIPGASNLKLPKVPEIPVPSALLPLLAKLKPVFAPICGEISTASDIVILVAPHYPQVIDGAAAVALFQSAVTCAELTGATS